MRSTVVSKPRLMHVASVQRFWENDMHQNKDLKHVAQKCAAILGQRDASKQRFKARRLNPFRRGAP
ncbi:MAG: hypothetical protein EOQ40_18210 [Mesorhizobium sp.]|nr:MAG: hypothetical protein EOQ40_18210 [Mesorhizobium sp.]